MEFAQGQVFSIGKISEHIKNTKAKKQAETKRQEAVLLVSQAKEEILNLKSRLNYVSDTEAIEASIYRLKAAELDLNRQLRAAKSQHHTS